MQTTSRFWQGWASWGGVALALAGALSYFLLSTPLVIGMALAAGDPRRIGAAFVLVGLLLATGSLWPALRRPTDRNKVARVVAPFLATLGLAGAFLVVAYLTFPYRVEAVRFSNGDVDLAGTLLTPGGSGQHPAVVFMHGSGPERGAERFYLADRFARHGIAALVYDKRGVGASRGGQPRDSYRSLAEDALAGVRFLQQIPEIDSRHIGVWGMSEGGWTAPLAAALSPDIAFLIVVSGAGASVEMESYYFIERSLREKGFTEAEAARAVALRRQINEYYRTGTGGEEVREAVRQAQGHGWLTEAEFLPRDPGDVCAFGSTCAGEYLAFIDFDSTPLLESLNIPMLFLYGEKDRSHPVTDSVEILQERLVEPGDKDVTIVVFPEADHSMLVWSRRLPQIAPGYVDVMTEWLLERVPAASHAQEGRHDE